MATHPLDRLDVPTRILKRAQYEAFTFSLCEDGILVRNESHLDPSEHEYTVTIEEGHPTGCTCPANRKFDGACKHRVAVAIRRPVLDAVAIAQVATDGGVPPSRLDPADGIADSDEEDACSDCDDQAPCWECFRTGRRDFPNRSRPDETSE